MQVSEIKSVCVYCGSSNRVDDAFKTVAASLGVALAERSITVIYGGGRLGLMGVIADSALAAGGDVVGIIPRHLQDYEVGHSGVTELLIVDSMHTRKEAMFQRSDAFIVLPGGLGTLDEFFEIVTWKQLGLHDKPIVLLNEAGYWSSLVAMIDQMVEARFCHPDNRDLFAVVDGIPGVFEAISAAPVPRVDPRTKWL